MSQLLKSRSLNQGLRKKNTEAQFTEGCLLMTKKRKEKKKNQQQKRDIFYKIKNRSYINQTNTATPNEVPTKSDKRLG